MPKIYYWGFLPCDWLTEVTAPVGDKGRLGTTDPIDYSLESPLLQGPIKVAFALEKYFPGHEKLFFIRIVGCAEHNESRRYLQSVHSHREARRISQASQQYECGILVFVPRVCIVQEASVAWSATLERCSATSRLRLFLWVLCWRDVVVV